MCMQLVKNVSVMFPCRLWASAMCCRYGAEDGWEVVFGYDQEKMMGDRAGAALVIDLKDVDSKQRTPAMSMV